MSDDYGKWEAVGDSVYVEGPNGEFVCDCADGAYGAGVGIAVADLIAREHNSLPSLRDQLRDKDKVIDEMQAQMRIVQRAHARQRENLSAEILMLRYVVAAFMPVIEGMSIGDIIIRNPDSAKVHMPLRHSREEYSEACRDAVMRADLAELYYIPIEKILKEGFHGYIGHGRAEDIIGTKLDQERQWKERAQGKAGDNRPSEPAFGSMAHPPEGTQPDKEDGA